MRRNQKGMTLLSFIIVMAVVGFFLYIVMKLFPMYNEYFSVKTALKGVASEPEITNKDPAQIKDMLFRRLYVSYSSNVKPEHVRVENDGSGLKVYVNYEVRESLVGNLDVVGRFSAMQDLSGATLATPSN
ncbi:MAG: DUF4845 domain-containing protein [Lysobacteraceae bacterium]|nr:MAG: DUF4845 domain-containing protein [Xanthomonadaceae bacterium]